MRISVFVGIIISPLIAFAQIDFTRQILSNGRYEVRKQQPRKPTRFPASETKDVVIEKTKVESEVVTSESKTSEVTPTSVKEEPSNVTMPSVGKQLESIFKNDSDEAIEEMEKKLDPKDPRRHRLEIEGLTGYTGYRSVSNYSHRSYDSSYAHVGAKANVWLAPAFALAGHLKFSLGASIPADSTKTSTDYVKDEEMGLALRFRRHFGLSRLSSSIEFQGLYLDRSFNVSTDSTTHARLRSSGLGLGMISRLPASLSSAWNISGRIYPRLKHVESGATGFNESGSAQESVRVDFGVGRELILESGETLVYGIGMAAEKNLFNGSASAADPVSGLVPTNVTVTQTLFNFSFGYRWSR